MNLIKNDPKVYIVILNWNGWQDTLECLESLQKLNYHNFQVIIVDNGSTDDSIAKISAWIAGKNSCVLLETKANLGYAAGNNVGLRYALDRNDFGYVWILNNDTVVDPEALTQQVRRLQEKPKAGMCGSIILSYNDPTIVAAVGGGLYDRWLGQAVHPGSGKTYDPNKTNQYLKQEKKLGYIEGASTLVSREFLQEVGLMNEDYFLFFEEVDWAVRARKRFTLAIAPKSLVYHKGGASVKKKEKENKIKSHKRFGALFDYYNTRNRLLFTYKYYPYALPIVFLSVLGYCLDHALYGAWGGIWIIVTGVVDAILGRDSHRPKY
ncbi:MAG: glycosyltransferase family 2 protein [bacterium]